jgi:hypothetical protein
MEGTQPGEQAAEHAWPRRADTCSPIAVYALVVYSAMVA